jgi:hypothetical protein
MREDDQLGQQSQQGGGYYPPDESSHQQGSGLMGHSTGSFLTSAEGRNNQSTQ